MSQALDPLDATLDALIEAQIKRHSQHTAVICDHDTSFGPTVLTYDELNAKVNQLAHRLRNAGVGPGQIVAIRVTRSFAMIIGLLSIIKAGAAYLPLSPEHPDERIDYTLKDAGVRILLTQRSVRPISFDGVMLDLDDPGTYTGSTANPARLSSPRDLAYVIYTSGSTGRPKGVMIEHRSVVNRLHWMQEKYPIGEGDVILQKTPYSFDVSVWELFWWALAGASLCFLNPGGERYPLAIVEAIRKHRVTVMHFVPSMLNVFLEYLEGKERHITRLASVRQVFASGEALTVSHVRKFNALWASKTGVRLANLYGPTEATVDVTYFDCPADDSARVIPIGKPIANTKLYIIRDNQQVRIGEAGELCVAGVGLARGYLNKPELTSERFIDNPVNRGERIYRTGDIVRWLDDGNVEYLGREDHQVKIRGLRIELGEIENIIRGFTGVSDCVALVKSYSESIAVIVAYVVCRHLDVPGLTEYLRKHLPDYMIPGHFERIDEVPLTPTGKADRQALPEPVLHGHH